MAEPSMFDDYADLMDVSLTSEYDRMENLDEDVLDDVVQIIIETLVQYKRKPTKCSQLDEDFSAFIATLTSKDRVHIDECIEALNNQSTIPCENSEAKKKRKEFSSEQIHILEAEFSKCQSPDPCKCEEIAKILKLSSRKVNSWFKKRRTVQESSNQSSSNGSIKLTLRLIKHSEDVNAWSVLRQDTQNCSSSVSKSLASCNSKEFLPPSSMSHCSEQSDPQNNNQYKNTEFQDDILTAKRLITGRRLMLNAERKQRLEEEFSVSQFVSAKKRRKLSESLGISETQVKHWFHNNRRRHRRELAKKNGNDNSVSTMSSRKRKRRDVSSTAKEKDFDELSVCSSTSSFAWDLEDSQSCNSDFGSAVDNDASSSKRCKSERTNSWEDNELSNPFTSEEIYSLLSSLGWDNMCPNLGMI